MTDFTPSQTYEDKDNLLVGDPDKLVLGAELDVEWLALQTAIATKYDSSDIATQVQAEAGASNSVLMTPLRVTQLLADSGGAKAGILGDLISLADPDADRILFWDDSLNAAGFLSLASTLSISGTTLSVAAAFLNHDSLAGVDANQHIDHSGVTITMGSGLKYSSGGGDLTASATAELDVDGLTSEATLALATDTLAFYDDSASAMRKVTLDAFVGKAIGDGRWYRNTNQTMSANITLTAAFDVATYDALELGTFNTTTGAYKAGADGARILISAVIRIDTIKDDEVLLMTMEVGGIEVATNINTNAGNVTSSTDRSISITTTLDLSANQSVIVRIKKTVTADAIVGGDKNTFVSIVELG